MSANIVLIALALGAVFMATKNKGSGSRGIRNNNPGNLVLTNIQWNGKIPNYKNTDGVYEQFIKPEYGIRALYLDIKNDVEKKGQNTIAKLITAYAPPSENPTQKYIDFVSAKTGMLEFQTIYPFNYIPILKAIIEFENGSNPYSDSLIEKAISL